MTAWKKAAIALWRFGWRALRTPHASLRLDLPASVIIEPQRARWCAACGAVSNALHDHCPHCLSPGTLFSITRLFPQTPEYGRIDYIVADRP